MMKENGGKSTHAGDNIGNFKVVQMAKCIAEINYWESKAKAEGTPLSKENSRNNICKRHGISPSTLLKRMTDTPTFFFLDLDLSSSEELSL